MSDISKFHEHLRATTVKLLGYDDADRLTAAQEIRVDRAVRLRLMIDDLQARQVRGEQIDVRAFVAVSLERMVGGNPVSPPEGRFGPDHREKLRLLIEKTLLADNVVEAEAERLADAMRREEAIAAEAAAPVEATAPAPSAPASPSQPPPSQQTTPPAGAVSNQPLPRPNDGIPAHYLKGPDEPWRPFVNEDGVIATSPWRRW